MQNLRMSTTEAALQRAIAEAVAIKDDPNSQLPQLYQAVNKLQAMATKSVADSSDQDVMNMATKAFELAANIYSERIDKFQL